MRDFLLDPGFILSAAIILNIVGGYWCWDVLTRQKRADNKFLQELEARRRPRRQAYQEDKGEDEGEHNSIFDDDDDDLYIYGSDCLAANPMRFGVDD